MRILSAEYVLPITSEVIHSGAVAFEGDTIVAVGTAEHLSAEFPNVEAEDFGRAAIIPGFVNCHSHLEITAMRGLLDDVEHDFTAWLLRLNDIRENRLAEADIELAAIAGALEGAAAGVTCFGDIGRNGRAGLEALKKVGLRGIVYQETNFSPGDRTADADFDLLCEKVTALRESATELVRVGVSPHSPYTVSAKLFSLIAEYAQKEDLKVSIHAAESVNENQLMRRGTGLFLGMLEKYSVRWQSPGCSSIEYLERTGILRIGPLLTHCIYVTDSDIELIQNNSASVAHCPKSNAKFGHGAAPFEALRDAGVKVGLGSDSVASNNICDMFEEARFASLIGRNRPSSKRFIGASEMLEVATLGGAQAMGLEDKIGSIEIGKKADLAVVSLAHFSQAPVNDIHAALIHGSNGRDVRLTVVAGRDVYRDGRSVNYTSTDLLESLERLRQKINPG